MNFTYWTHLIIGVCFYGAIGIWAELLRHYLLVKEASNSSIILAMHSTYPAIIGATAMQLLLNKDAPLYQRSFAQLLSTVFFTMAGVCILVADKISSVTSFRLAIAGLIASIVFWWYANAENEDLKDVDANASTGGDLPEPSKIAPKQASDEPVETPLGVVKL